MTGVSVDLDILLHFVPGIPDITGTAAVLSEVVTGEISVMIVEIITGDIPTIVGAIAVTGTGGIEDVKF